MIGEEGVRLTGFKLAQGMGEISPTCLAEDAEYNAPEVIIHFSVLELLFCIYAFPEYASVLFKSLQDLGADDWVWKVRRLYIAE